MSDTRQAYRQLTDAEKAEIAEVKAFADDLIKMIQALPGDPRGKSIAVTKVEEAAMWAVKAATA